MPKVVRYIPRELLAVENDLLKCILASVGVPDLLDHRGLFSAISNMNLCSILVNTN